MEKTLVILKPSCLQRSLIGEVVSRFEKKGLTLVGMKMMQLTDQLIKQHYAHLLDKPFFGNLKKSMQASPVIILCWEGIDAAKVVRTLIGVTNGRESAAGTIRGDFAMSTQENIVHASDSFDSAQIEIARFFKENEIFDYKSLIGQVLYSPDEV